MSPSFSFPLFFSSLGDFQGKKGGNGRRGKREEIRKKLRTYLPRKRRDKEENDIPGDEEFSAFFL